jgi:NADH dehydrogenase
MKNRELHVVTGAFGYTGRHLAKQLLAEGHKVRTLTNSRPVKDPFCGAIDVAPLAFDDQAQLVSSLAGAKVLYNTYWVRFNHRWFSHAAAVENTKRLFDAAKLAGVKKIVHVSITNPDNDSPFEYFRGKAELESYLANLGVSYSILRPAVLFGHEDILINNIAWVLRYAPVYGLFGDGKYGIQPIHLDDFVTLLVRAGTEKENQVLDAVGPESFSFRELVETIGQIIDCPRKIISISPWLGWFAGKLMGLYTRDVVITWEEIGGLMAGLLAVKSAPLGTTRLTEWARANRDTLGRNYASELARRQVA